MADHVSWLLEVAVKPGELDTFKALMAEMVESTRTEPGTLIYEWWISDDRSAIHLYERYADSPALLAHRRDSSCTALRATRRRRR